MEAKTIVIGLGEGYPMVERENHKGSADSSSNILQYKAADGRIETVVINQSAAYRFIKRFFDIVLSLIALVVLSPVFLITAIAIKLEDGEPVIFTQDRSGLNGKVFKMYKFRSMRVGADKEHEELKKFNELDGPAFKMRLDPRITKVGRFIRKTSIDELPQLVNILKGEMSIVGPRPLPTYETEECTPYQKQRLNVLPGLTCYWQVSGRNDIPFDEWIEMDLKYIKSASILTDLKLILLTFGAVIRGGWRLLIYPIIKRMMDIVLGVAALIALFPVFLITAVCIKREDGGAVMFTQTRIGMYGKPFKMYKFRSMRMDAEKIHEQMRKQYGCDDVSFKLKDDPRVTKIGKVIRALNIDELPQIINIVKGDMSLVGPRPLPDYEFVEEQRRFKGKYDERYMVPGGLTCIWQVSDRSEPDFADRMQMDVDYSRTYGLLIDVKLCLLTAVYSVTGKAAY